MTNLAKATDAIPGYVHELHRDLAMHCAELGWSPELNEDSLEIYFWGFRVILDFDPKDTTFLSMLIPDIVESEPDLSPDDMERICARANRRVKCCYPYLRKREGIGVGCDLRVESAKEVKPLLSEYLSAMAALVRKVWYETEKLRAERYSERALH